VAAHAVRRIQRVVVVDMAGQARRGSRGRMRSCQCKSRHTMVKGSCIPPLSGMTT
jgi:hypothetical protein